MTKARPPLVDGAGPSHCRSLVPRTVCDQRLYPPATLGIRLVQVNRILHVLPSTDPRESVDSWHGRWRSRVQVLRERDAKFPSTLIPPVYWTSGTICVLSRVSDAHQHRARSRMRYIR